MRRLIALQQYWLNVQALSSKRKKSCCLMLVQLLELPKFFFETTSYSGFAFFTRCIEGALLPQQGSIRPAVG
jgi:hypothetical protein